MVQEHGGWGCINGIFEANLRFHYRAPPASQPAFQPGANAIKLFLGYLNSQKLLLFAPGKLFESGPNVISLLKSVICKFS